MKVQGAYNFKAKGDRVWASLMSPDVLAQCIPGCQALAGVGGDKYEIDLKVGLGAISGTYSGTVALADKEEHSSFKMLVYGKGGGTTIQGEGLIRLNDNGAGTEVTVEGDAQITGVIARVGQRLLGSVAKTLIDQFFNCMKAKVETG